MKKFKFFEYVEGIYDLLATVYLCSQDPDSWVSSTCSVQLIEVSLFSDETFLLPIVRTTFLYCANSLHFLLLVLCVFVQGVGVPVTLLHRQRCGHGILVAHSICHGLLFSIPTCKGMTTLVKQIVCPCGTSYRHTRDGIWGSSADVLVQPRIY